MIETELTALVGNNCIYSKNNYCQSKKSKLSFQCLILMSQNFQQKDDLQWQFCKDKDYRIFLLTSTDFGAGFREEKKSTEQVK